MINNIDLIDKELTTIYQEYFNWFKNQEKYLKEGTITSHPYFINIKSQLGLSLENLNNSDLILVYGQETYGYPSKNWRSHISLKKSKIGEFFNKNSFYDTQVLSQIYAFGFDFPNFNEDEIFKNDHIYKTNFSSHFRGPFWTLIKNIQTKNKYVVSSNIIKFDVYKENSPKRRINKSDIQNEERESFYSIHRELIRSEIQTINPGKIIFFSSPNESSSIYNKIIAGLFNDYKSSNSFFREGLVDGNKLFIQSIHPRRLNGVERNKLLERI